MYTHTLYVSPRIPIFIHSIHPNRLFCELVQMEKYFHSNSNTDQNLADTSFSARNPSTVNENCALFPLLFSPYQTTSNLATDPSQIFNFLTNASFIPIQNDHSPKLEPVDSMEDKHNKLELKIPKTEEINLMEFGHVSAQSLSLFPPASTEYSTSGLLQLPDLCSLEEEAVQNDSELVTEPYLKRLKTSLYPVPYTAGNPYSDFQMPVLFHSPATTPADPKLIRQSEMSRRRRQRFREKINSLKKLLQWEKKMDTTATLEMAYKYIKFLQTQITLLEAMPRDCLPTVSNSTEDLNNFHVVAGGGELEMMSRNELLQILVNSPAIQMIMCSKNLCVYSIEQLVEIICRLFSTEEASLILNSMVF